MITAPDQLKSYYKQSQAIGAPAINANFAIQIVGFEDAWLSAKQAPWVTITPRGEIEVPGPAGLNTYIPQSLKTEFTGPITLIETESGYIDSVITRINAIGSQFDAIVYEGTPDRFTLAKEYRNCFLQIEPVDRDHENRAQVLTWSGSLFFHYFGEILPGNLNA